MKQSLNDSLSGAAASHSIKRRDFVSGIAGMTASLASTGLLGSSSQANAQTTPAGGTDRPAASKADRVVASDESTVTEITSGKLRGYRRNGVYTFKGVPYGASTAGERRFMPPARPEPWTGIRNALQYGRVCPNRDAAHFATDGHNSASSDEDAYLLHRGAAAPVMGEDCLRLNVWTPEINGKVKRPVMVFMHGGGYTSGNAHELLSYDGENLARHHDVVVVTHNHRVNVFGYLNLASLGGEQYASSANVGLLDIVAVLEWVRDNIASFGGDASSVTIFGQSGGGGKVLSLMAMPSAKGLFHKAISQSGPYLQVLTPDYSTRVAEQLLKELSLSRSELRKLHEISTDRLHGAAMDAIAKIVAPPNPTPLRRVSGADGWGPTADGLVLPHQIFTPEALAISASIPLITGTNLNEFINGVDHPDPKAMTMDEASRLIRDGIGGDTEAIIAAYRKEYPSANPFNLYTVIAASSVRHGGFEQARRKSTLNQAPAYSYLYSWRTPTLNDRPGVFHAAELAFVFDNPDLCDHYSAHAPDAFALSKQMSKAWVSFARTGNPNHPGMPIWPSYTAQRPAVMDFNTHSAVRIDPEAEGLRLIAQP